MSIQISKQLEEVRMWKAFRKRRALKAYRRQLPVHLRRSYGTKQHYTPQEVQDTVRIRSMSDAFLCYALAMYCDRVAFDAFHSAAGEDCDYGAMRNEAAHRLGVPTETTPDGGGPEAHAEENVFASGDANDVGGFGFNGSSFDGGSCGGDGGGGGGGGCDGGGGGGGD